MGMELEFQDTVVVLFWLKQKRTWRQNTEETIMAVAADDTRAVIVDIKEADTEDITTRRITIDDIKTITDGIITTKNTTIALMDTEIAAAIETNITTEFEKKNSEIQS